MKRILFVLLLTSLGYCAWATEAPTEPTAEPVEAPEQPEPETTWSVMLRATGLYASGEAAQAAKLMDGWMAKQGEQPLSTAFYSTRFFIAWLGQGDVETARRMIARVDALVTRGDIPANDPHYTLMTQSYYNHLLGSDLDRAAHYARRVGKN